MTTQIILHEYMCCDCTYTIYTSALSVPWCCQDWMSRVRSFEVELSE